MTDTKYYLAVDIGASSGRHILGHMEDGRLLLEEIYRFDNGNELVTEDGRDLGPADGQEQVPGSHRVWDTTKLFSGILEGLRKCKEAGKIPQAMGVDTWAVDYVLLDENDEMIGPCYAYRDGRTKGMDEAVYRLIPERELYQRTGIQKAIFNTIYQLMADKTYRPDDLRRAKSLLMVPDYCHFLLTGVKRQEYTNASSTGLLNPATREWDRELIKRLGYPQELFRELSLPGTLVGALRPEIADEIGFTCNVILPATHDTGSAVMSVPLTKEDTLYISSGTWSLFGCELPEANCSIEAEAANFTNEGGYNYRFRFLKNIMGLWMIQSVRKEFLQGYDYPGRREDEDYSFGNLCEMAAKEEIASLVDANDERFLSPSSMIAEVQAACQEAEEEIPTTPWQIARVIYRSLAVCYREALSEIEDITGRHFDTINIVGGGSNAKWLNELTAQETGRTVLAGPGEATAIGNLGALMIADGCFTDLFDFRRCVYESFGVKEFE